MRDWEYGTGKGPQAERGNPSRSIVESETPCRSLQVTLRSGTVYSASATASLSLSLIFLFIHSFRKSPTITPISPTTSFLIFYLSAQKKKKKKKPPSSPPYQFLSFTSLKAKLPQRTHSHIPHHSPIKSCNSSASPCYANPSQSHLTQSTSFAPYRSYPHPSSSPS